MSNIPDYGNIGGDPLTNDGKHYKIWVAPDSQGTPGVWHVYYNGEKVFLRSPAAPAPTVASGGLPNSIADSAAAALSASPAPAPAPAAPINSSDTMHTAPAGLPSWSAPSTPQPASAAPPADPQTGGLQAPTSVAFVPQSASAAPPADSPVPTASAAGDSPQETTGTDADGHTWLTNDIPGNPRQGQQYYVEKGHDSKNNQGEWHIYKDGSRQFVGEDGNVINDADFGNYTGTVITANTNADTAHRAVTADFTGGTQQSRSYDSSAPAETTDTLSNPGFNGQAYTVVSGDTMWDIAQRNGMSLDQLKALNPQVKDASLIHPGEQINLGDATGAAVAEAASFPANSTYDATGTQSQSAEPKKVGLGGWSDGTSAVPSDPVSGVAAISPVQTDPLKINHDKQDA